MDKHAPTTEDRIAHADAIIRYYEGLATSGRHSFCLGLYMARQWRRYLDAEHHESEELRLFLAALESGAPVHGSGWCDLALGVKWWLRELEAPRRSAPHDHSSTCSPNRPACDGTRQG